MHTGAKHVMNLYLRPTYNEYRTLEKLVRLNNMTELSHR